MGGSCKAPSFISPVSNLENLHGATQVNRNIVPGFYRYLQAQDQTKQVEFADELNLEVSFPFLFFSNKTARHTPPPPPSRPK